MIDAALPQLIRSAQREPWAILPDALRAWYETLERSARMLGPSLEGAAPSRDSARIGVQQIGSARVIPLHGMLLHRSNFATRFFGIATTDLIGEAIEEATDDAGTKTIVLDFNSPGGTVAGVQELAAKIRAARGRKRIVAHANSMIASAAYWLAAQATEIVVTPSGEVGSIGVVAMHHDFSEALAAAGIRVTVVRSVPGKAEGNPVEPLSDDALEDLQAKIAKTHQQFVADVAKGRGVSVGKVRSDFGGGRMVLAADAVSRGMADRTGTLPDVLARYTRARKHDGRVSAENDGGGVLAAIRDLRRASQIRQLRGE